MSKNLRKYIGLIRSYEELPAEVQKIIIKNIPGDLLNAVCEICLNIYKCNIPINSKQKQKLLKHKQKLKVLCNKRINKKIKKKKLIQSGGGLLGLVFSTILPLLTTLFK